MASSRTLFSVRTTPSGSSMQSEAKSCLPCRTPRWLRLKPEQPSLRRDLGRQRLGAWFFSGFGLTALIVATGSIFGLVSYIAESRQREFAIRIALGANWRRVVWHGLAAALGPVATGLFAGLLAGSMIAKSLTSILAGLSPIDLVAYVAVSTVMMVCALLAGIVAAWRLRLVEPSAALRTE